MATVEGIHYQTGAPVRIVCEQGKIASIEPFQTAGQDHVLPLLCPGLVDLQLNGYMGLDFNTLPLQEETVHQAIRLLWEEGVTSVFPTIITNSSEAIRSALRAVSIACRNDRVTEAGIAGIHLEGPFLSPEDGPRGAHNLSYIQAPNWELFQAWQEAAEGRIRIITLSPEWPGAAEFIKRCVDTGVTVSIGHTAASPEQIREAAAAGASMSTHFGNGAHLMLPRHPNYLWEQLAEDELWTCLIADGFHLPDSILKVVMRMKAGRALLVSDAVMLSGLPCGEYETHIGGMVVLTPEGRLHLASQPKLLAGSAQLLPWGIAHLVKRGLCTLAEAWEMASIRPAAKLGLPQSGGLEVGAPADLVCTHWDEQRVRIAATYKAGVQVFRAEK